MLVIRHISQEEFGTVSLFQSVIAVSASVFLQGLHWAMIRGIAAQKGSPEKASDLIRGTFWMTVAIAFLVACIAFVIVTHRWGSRDDDAVSLVAFYVSAGIVCAALMNFAVAVMQGREQFRLAAATAISQSLMLVMVYGVLAISHALSYRIVLVMIASMPIISFVIYLIYDATSIRIKKMDLSEVWQILNRGKVYIIYSSLLAVAGQLDILMMARYFSFTDVATYSVASKLFGILVLGLGAVHSVLLPRLSSVTRVEDLRAMFLRSLRYSVPIAALLVLVTWTWPSELIGLFAGAKYSDARVPLQILGVCAAISLVLSPSVNVLFALERIGLIALGGVLVLVVGLSGHILVTSRYGAVGAAWTTFCAYTAINSFFFFAVLHLTARRVGAALKHGEGL
jgi:O-antigen/teichoic acid export membrane protein